MNMKLVVAALATYTTAMTLVFTIGSAKAEANNRTAGKTAGKPKATRRTRKAKPEAAVSCGPIQSGY